MDVQQAKASGASDREQHSYARLSGRWIVLARGAWITLVILTLVIFFASLPMYLVQLQTPCTELACEYQQLTHAQAEAFKGIGLSLGDYAALTIAIALISIMLCLVVSTLIIWRRPDDRMAFFVALLLITIGPIIEFGDVPLSSSSPWLMPNLCMSLLAPALLMLVFLLFPSGRFVPRWTPWAFLASQALQIPLILLPVAPLLPNNPVSQFGWFATVGGFVLIAAVQFYRFRRVSRPRERQQTKWVVFGLAVPITGYVVVSVLTIFFPALAESGSLYPLVYNEAGFLLPLCLPLSFGFAMLRSRLWDIDVLINRTLVYGLLTVTLLGTYLLLVFGGQYLLASLFGPNNPVVLVVSTLVVAALFQPLRKLVQQLVDRRFYRSKYDAAQVVTRFNETLRQEVNLDQLCEHMLTVVQQTMQPAHLSLWLKTQESPENQR